MVTLKGLMSGLGSAEAIFRLKLISLEKCFIAGVGSSLDRPSSDHPPPRITVRRSQSPAQGPRQTFAEARQEAFKGSYWKEIKIGLKKGKVSPQHHP